jgi:polyhydroxyalkanoate synthase
MPKKKSSDPKAGDASSKPDAASAVPFAVRDPEAFARNLARMTEKAGKAAAAWVEPRERGEVRDSISEPVADMVKTFSKVTEYWLSDPARAIDAQTRLFGNYMQVWNNSLRRMGGEPVADEIIPEQGDKRFTDPDWADNAFYDFLKQAYLVTSRWANDLVVNADGLDSQTRHKAEFYVRQLADAISPTNFPATNPQVLRETLESNGENLVRGMEMLAEDIAAGKGELKLRQADTTKFELGRNIALTPGAVVGRTAVCEIIQYEATTDKVQKRPLLICPPWINKFYILDLNPEKSFIRWAVEQGHTVFVISWVNPDTEHGSMGWLEYIRDGLQFGLDVVEDITGEKKIDTIGYCVGGTLLSAAMALFAQEGEKRVGSATLFTTQVDFENAGDLKVFVDEEQVQGIEKSMQEKGYLDGSRMATAFNMLRSRELIWPYVVNNYVRGKAPMPFDLLYWNSDSTRMSAANHSYYLRNCYLENNLSKGKMVLDGKTLDLSKVKTPIYNLAAREDHIAPAKSVYAGGRYFGGDVKFVLSGSGHIAGVVNPPASGKYQYWTNDSQPDTIEDWIAGASETPGSWWPHWHDWTLSMDKRQVKSRAIGSKTFPALESAPGVYVRKKI